MKGSVSFTKTLTSSTWPLILFRSVRTLLEVGFLLWSLSGDRSNDLSEPASLLGTPLDAGCSALAEDAALLVSVGNVEEIC